MKRSNLALLAAGVLFVLSIANLLRSREHEVSASGTKASAVRATLIAAPGRVEAVSKESRGSWELGGRLRAVHVEERDAVRGRQGLVGSGDDYFPGRRSRAGDA